MADEEKSNHDLMNFVIFVDQSTDIFIFINIIDAKMSTLSSDDIFTAS